jgi:hypothetical protein
VIKHGRPLKNRNDLCTLQGYRHSLLIIRYKHQRSQGGLLMVSYTCMYTRGLYGKGNEIISWHSLCVGSCFVLNDNSCCMHYHCRSTLHQICMSRINNDNVYQCSKIVFGDDNIHSCPCVAREKVRNLSLYMNSTLQCDSCNGILKRIISCSAVTPTRVT